MEAKSVFSSFCSSFDMFNSSSSDHESINSQNRRVLQHFKSAFAVSFKDSLIELCDILHYCLRVDCNDCLSEFVYIALLDLELGRASFKLSTVREVVRACNTNLIDQHPVVVDLLEEK